jgi:hypothetical protein
MRAAATRLSVLASALLALAACSSTHVTASGCQSDDACGEGRACSAGTCLPRAAPPATWSIEVAPTSDSAAGFTELVDVALPATAFDLTAKPKAALAGTLVLDANTAPLTVAHLVLTVPASIPGRPDLQFETDLKPALGSTPPSFALSIPSTIVGRAGTLRILPGAPDNLTHPATSDAVTVAPTLEVPISSKTLTVKGRLLSAIGDPQGGLIARAFQGGVLVSNVVETTADTKTLNDGAFTLMVPSSQAGPATAQAISVELEAAMTDALEPHFWTKPFALLTNANLGDIHLPALPLPNSFRLVFHGDADQGPSVAGAIVRARTVLTDDVTETIDFVRDGLTDAAGGITLSLFPGTNADLRLYDIAVIPPASSFYAFTCLEKFPLATGGTPTAPQNVLLDLARRAVVSGTIVGDDGSEVAGVVIVATRTAGPRPTTCDAYASPPTVTTTTGAHGAFTLNLDPGTYRFDYDPPAGAPYPRLTETGVVVASPPADGGVDGGVNGGSDAGTGPARTVRLLPSAIVEGMLRDVAGAPLPLAAVRFYDATCGDPLACGGSGPVLQAQARADSTGHYRAVIPFPSGQISPDASLGAPSDASSDAQ